jgi:guanylate kinase
MKHSGRLFVVSAPSGAGKTTLVEAVLKKLGVSHDLQRIITYTSRAPRQGEEAGRDYNYLSTQEFVQKIEEGFFIEWSNGLGHYYGTQKSIIKDLESGQSGILVIDRVGAFQILSQIPHAILVWIEVSDSAVLEHRLVRRGTETREQIQRRVQRAHQEIEEEREKKAYHYHVCNDIFDSAVQRLEEIILAAFKS